MCVCVCGQWWNTNTQLDLDDPINDDDDDDRKKMFSKQTGTWLIWFFIIILVGGLVFLVDVSTCSSPTLPKSTSILQIWKRKNSLKFKIFIQNEKNSLGDDDDNGNKLTSQPPTHTKLIKIFFQVCPFIIIIIHIRNINIILDQRQAKRVKLIQTMIISLRSFFALVALDPLYVYISNERKKNLFSLRINLH